MTLKEISKLAGVSPSTVSRIINKSTPKPASREVEEKVWKIVNETGYTPNTFAKALKCGEGEFQKTHNIACLQARRYDINESSFFSNLANCIQKEAYANGFMIKYSFTVKEIDEELKKKLLQDKIQIVVVLGRLEKQTYAILKKLFKYIICIGLNELDFPCDQIICSGERAGKQATEFLIQLNHQKIAYIGEMVNEKRFRGYYEALRKYHIPYNREYAINIFATVENGQEATVKLLEKHKEVTAIFCMNDTVAIGVLQGIKDVGLKSPEDISVISVDNIEKIGYLSPLLTTINIPTEEMAKLAIKFLSNRIEQGHHLPITVLVPFNLVKRESHRKIR
ncbi:MAG: LacI family DNA-binding transcriptional regulator [Eubacteriales bacterium]